MSDSAFVSHLVSQTRANIDFLHTQGYLTVDDAANIQSKLATATVKTSDKAVNLPVPAHQQHTPTPGHQPHPPNPPQPPQPTPSYPRARVLWAYNEDGRVRNFATLSSISPLTLIPKDPNDLAISVGDIIDIVEETNADWWSGRNRGKQGLFPSNYVQKLPPEPTLQPYQEKAYGVPGYTSYGNHPPPQQVNPSDNLPAVNSVGLQPDEGEGKKKKFGKFGNTVRFFPLPS